MNLNQFKDWALKEGSVATPIGTYFGECVSLIQQYLSKVFNIPHQSRGNAKDWATNANVLSHFDKVTTPQAGDIGVSGATSTNPYGHIWIYLTPNQILEQNGKVARRVSISAPYFKPIAVLRRKGVNMAEKVSLDSAKILTDGILRRDTQVVHSGKTDADLLANHVNRDLTNAYIMSLWLSPEAQAGVAFEAQLKTFYNKYSKLIGDLESRPTKAQLEEVATKLAAESAKVAKAEEALKAEQAKKSEDTVLLDEAGSWFSKLLNRLFKKG